MRTRFGTVLAAAVAVAEAILINRRSSFYATFAFFAAKHQIRVGSFSVEIAGIDPFDGCGFGRETALFDELE